jgi:hypothetical protein
MELFVTIVEVPYLSGFQRTILGLDMYASSHTAFTSRMSKDLLLFVNVSKRSLAMTWSYSELMYTLK